MAFSIGTIDSISRRLQRDVFQIVFVDDDHVADIYVEIDHITKLLDELTIDWDLCVGFTEGFAYIEGGPGCIYIDINPNEKIERIELLQLNLEELNKTGRSAICSLEILKLLDAMKNAGQDLPDFWDNF